MKILAADTSTKEIGIGIFDGPVCLYEKYTAGERKYNKVIMSLIDTALRKSGLELAEIDLFASTLGPGSFTGIRVGMSVMKAFAQAMKKKFSGVSTLEIMAAGACAKEGMLYPALDARRHEVYTAAYSFAKGKVRIKGRCKILGIDEYLEEAAGSGTVVILKDENPLEVSGKKGKMEIVELEHISMKSFNEVLTGNRKLVSAGNLFKMAPVYVRNPDIQEKMKKEKEKKK